MKGALALATGDGVAELPEQPNNIQKEHEMPEESSNPNVDFFEELKKAAEAIKVSAEAITAVQHVLDEATTRSILCEINNTTSRRLVLVGSDHDHGGFRDPPDPAGLPPGRSSVFFTAQSTGFLTGTEGNVRLKIEGTDTIFRLDWVVPFLGGNESSCRVEGPQAALLVALSSTGGGNTGVHMRYMLGEKVAGSPTQQDWRRCEKCATLYFGPHRALSHCASGAIHTHAGDGPNFRLPFGVDGLDHQPDWRYCLRCKQLYFDGTDEKGVCAAPAGHRSDGSSFFLQHSRTEDRPDDATHQSKWRFCIRCFGLYFEPDGLAGCPAGGVHKRFDGPVEPGSIFPPNSRAFNFRLLHDEQIDPSDHEGGWQKCEKCSLVFRAKDSASSFCEVTQGPHVATGVVFQLPTREPAGTDPFMRGWSACTHCKSLFFGNLSLTGVCASPVAKTEEVTHTAVGNNFHLAHDVAGPGEDRWRFCNRCRSLFFEPKNLSAPGQDICPAGGLHTAEGFNFRLSNG